MSADPATVQLPGAGEPTPANVHAPTAGLRLVAMPRKNGKAGAILPSDHCAECCTDSSCPRCWAQGAELVLEYPPLQAAAWREALEEPDPTQLLARA